MSVIEKVRESTQARVDAYNSGRPEEAIDNAGEANDLLLIALKIIIDNGCEQTFSDRVKEYAQRERWSVNRMKWYGL